MRDLFYRVFSREWAGLLIAAVVAALGLLAWPLFLIGAALALAALRHLWMQARLRQQHPPPGRMIDLGGYRVHLLAEGQAQDGRPAIVWFAGGHASGMAIHHLHRALRADTRSILIDRPGTGWSDTGPFPRSTAAEAEEMVLALALAGEPGPFIFAGHSFGGLLCANIARRHPALVHTLVLLDPTPLDTLIYGPRLGAIKEMRRNAGLSGLAMLFGLDLRARSERRSQANPAYARVIAATKAVLGPEVEAVRGLEARAGGWFAMASIFAELSPEGAAAAAWEAGVYDGDLADMPVLLVGPKNDLDAAALPEMSGGKTAHTRRIARVLMHSRERYLATSTRSQRVVAPAGTGHNFIYEVPEFTIDVVRGLLDRERVQP